jgi:hypothetical protein
MSRRTEKTPQEHVSHWFCRLCPLPDGDETQRTAVEFMAHLKEQHPEVLTDGKTGSTKSLTCALDGEDFYSNQFRCLLPDGRLLAINVQSGPRGRGM